MKDYIAPIHLVISDVIMPVMGGVSLAKRLRKQGPNLPILFISGYAEHSVIHNGLVKDGEYFLQKPFTPFDLARKVREVLSAVHR